jgi:8-oxo-dGTP pyrophosphatase MutT (NUDIX family)
MTRDLPPHHDIRRDVRRETSAGGVVVHRGADAVRYLLIRDSYENWGFPKGHVEAGESIESAAQREVIEETGLREVVLCAPLQAIEWQFQFRGERVHKTCHFFLMETRDPETVPQHYEGISACRWTTFEEAQHLVAYDNARGVLRDAHALATRSSA